MQIVTGLDAWRALRATWSEDIGFVPTMGGLHAGHRALMARARARHERVVVSIYVNPLQFGPREDFAAYPRTLVEDREALSAAGVDALFAPDDAVIYPGGREGHTRVWVPGLSEILCGQARPGHFAGVTTVVARLLGLIRPRAAYFGKKDYQQWCLIARMVRDLAWPVEVVGVETVRAADGLAHSTRNRYLSAAERAQAAGLYETLVWGAGAVRAGAAPATLERDAAARLGERGFDPDYVAVRRAADLAPVSDGDRALVILAAARLGGTRLIDNLEFERPSPRDGGSFQRDRKAG